MFQRFTKFSETALAENNVSEQHSARCFDWSSAIETTRLGTTWDAGTQFQEDIYILFIYIKDMYGYVTSISLGFMEDKYIYIYNTDIYIYGYGSKAWYVVNLKS